MKVRYLISILMIILVFSFTFAGCTAKEKNEGYPYKITTYVTYEIKNPEIFGTTSTFMKDYHDKMEGKKITKVDKIYYATKILSFSGGSVSFVDENGKERYITAEKIEVEQIE